MRYAFHIAGLVSDDLAETFPELDHVPVPDQDLFLGPVTDEAHLYGLLLRFQAVGLRVVEMRQLPE